MSTSSLPSTRTFAGASLRERLQAGDARVQLLVFRIGAELYAGELGVVEEAVDLPELHPLPEMPERMLGTFELRDRMTTVYSPAEPLGTPLHDARAAIVVRSLGRRVAIAVDDVDDVLAMDSDTLRPAPALGSPDTISIGVVRRGVDLIAVIDLEALVIACVQDRGREAT